MGYPVFYSDQVSKNLLIESNEVVSQIKNLLGAKAYFESGEANKPFIASKIFSNQTLLTKMNAIMHPAVRNAFKIWCAKQNKKLVFNEAAILFETDGHLQFDKTILVTAPLALKIKRIIKRDGLTHEQINNRMSKQWDDEKKTPLANYVIKNGENDMIIQQINTIINSVII